MPPSARGAPPREQAAGRSSAPTGTITGRLDSEPLASRLLGSPVGFSEQNRGYGQVRPRVPEEIQRPLTIS